MFPITNVPLSCCMAIINLSALVHLKKCFHPFLRNLLYYYFFATVSVYVCRCAHRWRSGDNSWEPALCFHCGLWELSLGCHARLVSILPSRLSHWPYKFFLRGVLLDREFWVNSNFFQCFKYIIASCLDSIEK